MRDMGHVASSTPRVEAVWAKRRFSPVLSIASSVFPGTGGRLHRPYTSPVCRFSQAPVDPATPPGALHPHFHTLYYYDSSIYLKNL